MARRVLGESDDLMFRLKWNYATALSVDMNATLDDLREAITTFEDIARTARRVLGGTHPDTRDIEVELRAARAALHVRETLEA